jgi:hypothetical protein
MTKSLRTDTTFLVHYTRQDNMNIGSLQMKKQFLNIHLHVYRLRWIWTHKIRRKGPCLGFSMPKFDSNGSWKMLATAINQLVQ